MIISTDGKFTHNLNENSIVTANLGVGFDALNKQYSIVSAFAGDPTASFNHGLESESLDRPWRLGLCAHRKGDRSDPAL